MLQVDSVARRIRSGWNKFTVLVPLLSSRGLQLRPKGRLYSACVRSVTLRGSETWPVKEEDVIRRERNDARMVRWMRYVTPHDRISEEELRTRLKWKRMLGLVNVEPARVAVVCPEID